MNSGRPGAMGGSGLFTPPADGASGTFKIPLQRAYPAPSQVPMPMRSDAGGFTGAPMPKQPLPDAGGFTGAPMAKEPLPYAGADAGGFSGAPMAKTPMAMPPGFGAQRPMPMQQRQMQTRQMQQPRVRYGTER